MFVIKRLLATKKLGMMLEEMNGDNRLRRVLGPVSLTSLGIGCIIGTGIFVVTGIAAHDKAGPALMVSYAIAGLVCIFAALCYAEFASMVPVAGSAFTYAYATLGELFAWIVGWDLVLEYTVASATVAHGWSKYFQEFLGIFNVHLPKLFTNAPFDFNPDNGLFFYTNSAIDLPAILITALVTLILVVGIKESTGFNSAMVVVKLAVVLFVIVVGAFYVKPENWFCGGTGLHHGFAPFGWTGISFFGHTLFGQTGAGGAPLGVFAGAAVVFFAYIGFDSVSTHAEEARNPQKDVPVGIIVSLLVCTLLYIAVTAVITGMVPFDKISVEAPVSNAFKQVGLPWAQLLVAVGAVAGITSVLLVLMLSQPRVLLAMARDGFLPPRFFGAVHERFRTPWKSTILTGIVVATMAALIPLRILAELVNIGTLLAFAIVCVAVIIMRRTHPDAKRPFRCPMVPLIPILGILSCILMMFSLPWQNWLRLGVWLVIGMIIYISYGHRHSVMVRTQADIVSIEVPVGDK